MKKKLLRRESTKKLRALAATPDSQIDVTDIPELTNLRGALVGKFYRRTRKSAPRKRRKIEPDAQ
jgi:hypothetical protein